jgi:hypothetical protein
MIVLALLILANLWLLQQTQQPQELVEVKEKYKVLREHLKETKNEKYRVLYRCIPITGMKRMGGFGGFEHEQGW